MFLYRLGGGARVYGVFRYCNGQNSTCPIDRMADRHDRKHYLSAASLEGGKNVHSLATTVAVVVMETTVTIDR